MNSKTAQLTENGTEIVRLFARFALGASFLSAVADRFGLWGPHGAKNVSWGDFAHFVEYTGAVTSLFPGSLTVSFAWAATVGETLFGILLIAGFKIRMASVLSGLRIVCPFAKEHLARHPELKERYAVADQALIADNESLSGGQTMAGT